MDERGSYIWTVAFKRFQEDEKPYKNEKPLKNVEKCLFHLKSSSCSREFLNSRSCRKAAWLEK